MFPIIRRRNDHGGMHSGRHRNRMYPPGARRNIDPGFGFFMGIGPNGRVPIRNPPNIMPRRNPPEMNRNIAYQRLLRQLENQCNGEDPLAVLQQMILQNQNVRDGGGRFAGGLGNLGGMGNLGGLGPFGLSGMNGLNGMNGMHGINDDLGFGGLGNLGGRGMMPRNDGDWYDADYEDALLLQMYNALASGRGQNDFGLGGMNDGFGGGGMSPEEFEIMERLFGPIGPGGIDRH